MLDPKKLRELAESHGQGHLFAFYDKLDSAQRERLLGEVASVEFDVIGRLVAEFVKGHAHAGQPKFEPPPVIRVPKSPAEKQEYEAARAAGEAALRAGRVASFLVAGGQGTRLGLHGPKGCFEFGPVTRRTLFEVHAQKIHVLRKKFSASVPWLVMTSDANDDDTKKFFAQHDYFGLGQDSVRIFKQANMPAVSRDGKILLQSPGEIGLSPNGHGGSIKALYDSGSIAWLKNQGIDTLFYFQVDNALTKIGDPAFIGFHVKAKAEMSTKVLKKRDWKEKVGVLGLADGKLSVIEYSDLPESMAKETDASGNLKWWAGNIAIHVLDTGFIERLNKGGFKLPYHKAEKAVPCIGPDGKPAPLKPGEKNAIKFETFVFDALSQAQTTENVETLREDDFSPVKNADGEDSPQTARRDAMEEYARWLTGVGAKVPRKPDGSLDCMLEIGARGGLRGEGLADVPTGRIQPGEKVVL